MFPANPAYPSTFVAAATAESGGEPARASASERPADRLRTLVVANHALVWRMLRRFGVSPVRVDEAVSQVFDILTRRLADVREGSEPAFLIQVCARVASDVRRGDARRARVEELAVSEVGCAPSPEELFEREEARALLDQVLDAIDPELRVVFVLHELEQRTAAEIAAALGIPAGTAASRLRRGREQFELEAAKVRRRLAASGRGVAP